MKCTKCGQENSAGSRFCSGCGNKLEKLCPECGHPVAETARFCHQCGQSLTDAVNPSTVMKDNVIAGDVNQSVHTNISTTTDQSIHASVVHIHKNDPTQEPSGDLRCTECAAFIPAAQKYICTCYGCNKYFCTNHLIDSYCATCRAEQALELFEFTRQGNQKYTITKLKDPSVTSVVIPSIVDTIGDEAFMGADLIEIQLPRGLLKIGDRAFANCKDLTKINFPYGLLKIGDEAFLNCSNMNVAPPGRTMVGNDAFAGTRYAERRAIERKNAENRKAEQTRIIDEAHKAEQAIKDLLKSDTSTESRRASESATYEFATVERSDRTVSIITKVSNIKSSDVVLPKYDPQNNLVVGIKGTPPTEQDKEGCSVFENAAALKSLYIPDSVTIIGDYAFMGCSSLTTVKLPGGLIEIGEQAFSGCSRLNNIIIPATVRKIKHRAFYGCCELRNVNFMGSVQVSNTAFESTPYKRIKDEDARRAKEIKERQNQTRHALNTATMKFERLSKNGKIVSIVKSISEYATGHVIIPKYDLQGNLVVGIAGSQQSTGRFMSCFTKGLKSITLPDSITFIGTATFALCNELTEITLPSGLTKIGAHAFAGCSKLQSVNIPNSVTSIGDSAFDACSALKSITLPDSLTHLGKNAFMNCSGMEHITLSSSLIKIENRTFEGCIGLTGIDLPENVTIVAGRAFYNCFKLAEVNHPDPQNLQCAESAFHGTPYLAAAKQTASVAPQPQEPVHSADLSFKTVLLADGRYANELYKATLTQGTRVEIPDSDPDSGLPVAVIGQEAFMNCVQMTEVSIPESIIEIQYSAFRRCSALTFAAIPDSVQHIREYAFYQCSQLIGVSLPAELTNIESCAFAYCSKLATIEIPHNVTAIEDSAFFLCSDLFSVTLPHGITKIGASAFYGCKALTSITIPESVQSIGREAFALCSGLKSIVFRGTKEQWNAIIQDSGDRFGYVTAELVICSDGSIPLKKLTQSTM